MVTADNDSPEFDRQAAVALGMTHEDSPVPTILASGRGEMAEKILQLAFAHGVKVRQDADLVEILTALEVDSPIPVEAFAVVAEIMQYVYQANATYAQRNRQWLSPNTQKQE